MPPCGRTSKKPGQKHELQRRSSTDIVLPLTSLYFGCIPTIFLHVPLVHHGLRASRWHFFLLLDTQATRPVLDTQSATDATNWCKLPRDQQPSSQAVLCFPDDLPLWCALRKHLQTSKNALD